MQAQIVMTSGFPKPLKIEFGDVQDSLNSFKERHEASKWRPRASQGGGYRKPWETPGVGQERPRGAAVEAKMRPRRLPKEDPKRVP